MEDLVAVVDSQ